MTIDSTRLAWAIAAASDSGGPRSLAGELLRDGADAALRRRWDQGSDGTCQPALVLAREMAERGVGVIVLGDPERMIAAVYARFTVVGTTFVEARLTAAAERHGLALALPETVDAEWRARPGTDPRFRSAMAEQRIRIPIAGRDDWERAARESA